MATPSPLAFYIDEITTRFGTVIVCAWCKKIREREGTWRRPESCLLTRTRVRFSQAMCSECVAKFSRSLEGVQRSSPRGWAEG